MARSKWNQKAFSCSIRPKKTYVNFSIIKINEFQLYKLNFDDTLQNNPKSSMVPLSYKRVKAPESFLAKISLRNKEKSK